MKRTLQIAVALLFIAAPICAQEPRALRNLRGLVPQVSIESEDSVINRILPNATLQTDVEAQLRKAGFNIGTKADLQARPLPPVLFVAVTGMTCDDLVIFNVGVSLSEEGETLRAPNASLLLTSWSHSAMGSMTLTDAKYVRSLVQDLINRFINDWRSANPSKVP